jgi:hypothetical protein
LKCDELLSRDNARDQLGLERDGRYALFSLGPGNLKDVSAVALGLHEELRGRGFTVVFARAPISVRDVSLPDDVLTVSVYPLVRYLRAFDVLASAAGYNACCEIVQAGVPSLLVPNTQVADDQVLRADLTAQYAQSWFPLATRQQNVARPCRNCSRSVLRQNRCRLSISMAQTAPSMRSLLSSHRSMRDDHA